MTHTFDHVVERRGTGCDKWSRYGDDVLPLWVADMDFPAPEPVLRALHAHIDHGVLGYGVEPQELKELLCQRMATLYGWEISPADILFLPGLVCGLNIVARAVGERGDGVLVNTPAYPPFLSAPMNQRRITHEAELATTQVMVDGRKHIRYEVDFDALEAAIDPNTRLFMFCNPHNPVGHAYTRGELERIAEMCARHNLVICSDEIHSDLLLGGAQHIPVASLSPKIGDQTITLIAPSKTFNLAGLGCSVAIVPNEQRRRQLQKAAAGIVPHVNVLGFTAALAAYRECHDWLQELRAYLTANRDFLAQYMAENMPQMVATLPEATYLAWIDCRDSGIAGNPYKFFLDRAKVALNDGGAFGAGGVGFVRLNFGCPRVTLEAALERMCDALAANVRVEAA